MINECVNNHNVISLLIESERFMANKYYYQSLGFIFTCNADSHNYLWYAYHSSFKNKLSEFIKNSHAANDEFLKKAA